MQRTIESNGIRLNIAEQGKGPPVILCHGFPESWYSWRHQLTALAAAGFHAVAPDMRGYGKSDRPEAIDQYTIFHLIGDLVGLLDALEAPTAVIVGHDWGAAYRLASGTPAPRPLPRRCKPQRTASAAWSGAPDQRDAADRGRAILPAVFSGARRRRGRDGAGSARHRAQHALRRVGRRRGGIPRSRSPRRDHANPGMVPRGGGMLRGPATPPTLPAWLNEADIDFYAGEFKRSGFRGPLNYYRNIDRNWELMAAFADVTVKVPALFIAGDHDMVMAAPPGMDQHLANLRQFVTTLRDVRILPGCGHWTQQERPSEVSAAIIDFIRGLPD